MRIQRTGRANGVDDYRFDLIQLNPEGLGADGKGVGEGSFFPSVRLRFNKNHELEIEDRRFNMPDEIRQLRMQPPSSAK